MAARKVEGRPNGQAMRLLGEDGVLPTHKAGFEEEDARHATVGVKGN